MTPPKARRIDEARRDAEEALTVYAELLVEWNAPDDEHTRIQLRGMVEEVIAEMPESSP